MASIVIFPDVCGARYYLKRIVHSAKDIVDPDTKRIVSKLPERTEFQLVFEREEASVFADHMAMALAHTLHGRARDSEWVEDAMKICSWCRERKSAEDDFYSAGVQRYPKLRRSICKKCDDQRRRA